MTPDVQIESRVSRPKQWVPQSVPHRATLLACTLQWLCTVPHSYADTTATMLPSGDAIELSGEGAAASFKTTIPVYRSGEVRYFSAGVGLEERLAKYPAFPLKLIFVAGPKAYLSKVSVTITNDSGTVRVDIPGDHVNGPWLFVDLPAGTYNIEAVSRGDRIEQAGVRATQGKTRTVYLRWPRGPRLF